MGKTLEIRVSRVLRVHVVGVATLDYATDLNYLLRFHTQIRVQTPPGDGIRRRVIVEVRWDQMVYPRTQAKMCS